MDRHLALTFITSSLLWSFGLGLFIYLQPLYIAALGASPAEIGWTLGLSGGLVVLLYIPLGWWADRHGRRPVILLGWGLATLATVGMALAPDWRWFIPAHAVYLLSDFAMPAYYGYLAVRQGGGPISRTLALITAGGQVGSIVSPAVGGWIGGQLGLRVVYASAAVAFCLSTLVLTRLEPQPPLPASPEPRPAGPRLSRAFWWQIVYVFLLFMALGLGQVMMPKFLADQRGLDLRMIGWLGTLGSAGIVAQTIVLSRLPEGRRRALVLAQVAALAAFGLLLGARALPLLALAYVLHGSNRVVRPFVLGRLARSLASGVMSLGYGVQQSASQLAWTLAALAAGLLYARQPAWPLLAGSLGLILTLALTFTLATEPARVTATALVSET